MLIYKFIFYKFSHIFDFFESPSEVNAFWNTLMIMSANALSLMYSIEIFLHKKTANDGLITFALAVLLGLALYSQTTYKGKNLFFEERFSTSISWKKKFSNAVALIYCIGSLSLFGYTYNLHYSI